MDSFARDVYRLVKSIPRGHVATYGDLALAAGHPRAARVVGGILHRNPDPDGTPCYRIVNREGRLAPAYAFGGEEAQSALLIADGVEVKDGFVDLTKYRHRF